MSRDDCRQWIELNSLKQNLKLYCVHFSPLSNQTAVHNAQVTFESQFLASHLAYDDEIPSYFPSALGAVTRVRNVALDTPGRSSALSGLYQL